MPTLRLVRAVRLLRSGRVLSSAVRSSRSAHRVLTALATITGEPLARGDGLAQVLEVVLAMFSVVVSATLAGSLGAFFLDRRAAHSGR